MWADDIDSAAYVGPLGGDRGGDPGIGRSYETLVAASVDEILAIETSCDETAAAVVEDGRGSVNRSVVSQPGRPPRPLRRRRARGGQPGPSSSCSRRSSTRPWTKPASPAVNSTAVAATVGPGLIGSLLVGVSAAKAYALAWGVPVRRRQPPGGPPPRRFPRGPRSGPAGGGAAGLGRPHPAHLDDAVEGRALPARSGRNDRRRRRRGLRQGRPLPRPRLPRRAGHRPGGVRRRSPGRSPFPRGLRDDGYDFSFSGLKTSVITYVRKHPETPSPTWPPRSRRRWSTCW